MAPPALHRFDGESRAAPAVRQTCCPPPQPRAPRLDPPQVQMSARARADPVGLAQRRCQVDRLPARVEKRDAAACIALPGTTQHRSLSFNPPHTRNSGYLPYQITPAAVLAVAERSSVRRPAGTDAIGAIGAALKHREYGRHVCSECAHQPSRRRAPRRPIGGRHDRIGDRMGQELKSKKAPTMTVKLVGANEPCEPRGTRKYRVHRIATND